MVQTGPNEWNGKFSNVVEAYHAVVDNITQGGTMSNIERAEQRVRSAQQQLELALKDLDKAKGPEYYDVETPVSANGLILFNNCRQLLSMCHSVNSYTVYAGEFTDCRNDFVWVPTKREDLKPGDVAYHKGCHSEDFSDTSYVGIIIDNTKYCYHDTAGGVRVSLAPYPCWYKLTPRSEVE